MPINPEILLGQQPVKIESPLDAMTKVLSLKHLAQQSQLDQSLLQERDVQTQEKQLEVAKESRRQAAQLAQAAAIKASVDPTTGLVDHDQAAQRMIASDFPENAEAYLKTVTATESSRQSLLTARRNFQVAGQEHLGELALNAKREVSAGGTPMDVQNHVLAHVATAAADGVITEDQAHWFMQQVAQANPTQLANVFDQFLTPAIRSREATTQKTTAEANLATMKATPPSAEKYQAQIDAIVPPDDKVNAGLRRLTMARVQNARTVEDADKAIDEAAKQVGQINVAKATVPYKIEVQTGGVDYEAADVNPTVKAIAEYRQAPPAIGRAGTRAIMDAVNRYNPAYDATQYQQRQKVRNAYTTGTEGQQLNALNTAIMHMDLLADAADALKNGDFKPGNAVYNKVKDLFGSATPNNYETIKEFLDGEVGAVVKKGVATEGEMGRLEKKAGASSSPEVLHGYIKNAVRILGGKAVVLDDKYHSVMGQADPFTAISPRAQDVLSKHGFDPSNLGETSPSAVIYARDPQGTVHQAKAGTALPAGWVLVEKPK